MSARDVIAQRENMNCYQLFIHQRISQKQNNSIGRGYLGYNDFMSDAIKSEKCKMTRGPMI